MKICLVSHQFVPDNPAGVEICVLRAAQALASLGHEVLVFTTRKDLSRRDGTLIEEIYRGVRTKRLIRNLFYSDFAGPTRIRASTRSFGAKCTFGIVILPHYDVTDRLELVAKYAYASNTVLQRAQRRAFDHNGVGRPNLDDVHTFYAGFNYRFCGDNFKLMGGYEYLTADLHRGAGSSDLGGISGDTWMLGVRTFW